MSTWVEEFHDFAGANNGNNQFGAMVTGGSMKSTFVPKKPSRKETLEAELKLLEWHKLANDAALKAALIQTKEIQEPMDSGGGGKRDPSLDEEAKRIRKIITNEQTKPLEVSRDYILNYEKKEAMDSEKLANQVERHIETLRTIRGKLEERVELKSRINEYRDWKKGFHEKKAAIMNGKTLQSYSADSQTVGGGGTGGAGRGGSGGSTRGTTGGGGSGATGGGKDLAVVLDSLNKLAQLEARITSLERDHDNMYEQMKGSEVATQQEAEKTALEFKKKRAVDPLQRGAAMKTVYTLKTKKVPVSKGIKLPKGTFLTAVERDKDTNNLRDARYREKQRQLALATSGQKNLRDRVRIKKSRQLQEVNSHRKHEEALQELSKRRSEQKHRLHHSRPIAGVGTTTFGAAGGKRFKNKYLNDFNEMKKDHLLKKEQRERGKPRAAAAGPTGGGPGAGPGGGPTAQQRQTKNSSTYLSSQTAPTGATRTSTTTTTTLPHAHAHAVPRRPPPTTRTAGTVTRRVTGNSMPARRPYGGGGDRGGDSSQKMPAIVGSGVGGVRALREQKRRR